MADLIPVPTHPRPLQPKLFAAMDVEIDALLDIAKARETFQVDGSGLTAAVLDTGLRVTHRCFKGRVKSGKNFLLEEGAADDVADLVGHGTNVAGIIAADAANPHMPDARRGIAPAAQLVPLRVLPAPDIKPIVEALQWVEANAEDLGITVVNMSFGIPSLNHQDDALAQNTYPALHATLRRLHEKRIAVVVAAGNYYGEFGVEGMTIPAIFREVIAVGAVYDASVGSRNYPALKAHAFMTRADQITPFTQRLAWQPGRECYTDIFSSGAIATSAGHRHDEDTSVQDGTSQAAPTITGLILLLQQYHQRLTGEMPEIGLLQDVLRSTSTWLVDGDDEQDNVPHSMQTYPRVNAFESLSALDKHVKLKASL